MLSQPCLNGNGGGGAYVANNGVRGTEIVHVEWAAVDGALTRDGNGAGDAVIAEGMGACTCSAWIQKRIPSTHT